MPYNFAADSFHTKKHCSRLASSDVRFYTEIGRLAFLSSLLEGLRATTYDVHLGLIGKSVVNFVLGLLLVKLLSLVVTAEGLGAKIYRKSAISLQRGQFDPKFQVEGVAPTNHFCTVS